MPYKRFGIVSRVSCGSQKVADPSKTLASLPSLIQNHCYLACKPEAPYFWEKHLQAQNVLTRGKQGCCSVEAVDPFAEMRLCINVR
jgi:hypothetical protein